MQANEQVAPGQAHPVTVKQPCGFCGNSPPYMCATCNDYGDPAPSTFESHDGRRSIVGTVPPDFWFV
jgi:hypothetical protein